MRNPPFSVLMTWPKPNYEDPETRGKAVLVINVILLAITIVVVAMRLWARCMIVKMPGADDILIAVALCFGCGLTSTVILTVYKYGWDRHIWDVPFPELAPGRLVSWTGQGLFVIGSSCTKISILLFYRRLVAGTIQPLFVRLVWLSIVLILIYMFGYIFYLLLGCHPLNAYWGQYASWWHGKKFHCVDEGPPLLLCGIISVFTDVIVVVLPGGWVWGVRMPVRQRVGLWVLFGLGLIVCIAGIIRTVYIHRVLYDTYDVTWHGYSLWNVTIVEHNLAIICASAPALKPFFKKYLPHSSAPPTHPSSTGYYPSQGDRFARPKGQPRSRATELLERLDSSETLGAGDARSLREIEVGREVEIKVYERSDEEGSETGLRSGEGGRWDADGVRRPAGVMFLSSKCYA